MDTITFAGFMASRATALYREALVLTGSQRQAEVLLEETLIRTGLAWREAMLSDPERYARAVMAQLAAKAPRVAAEIATLVEAPTTQAPRDLAERVARGIATRKRRNRHRGMAIAAGLALAILAAFGVSALRGDGTSSSSGPRATPSSPYSAPPPPSAPSAPAALDPIIDRGGATRLPVQLANGLHFRAAALGSTGIVIGGTGFDFNPYRETDGLVWTVGPGPARQVTLSRPPSHQPWAHAVGITVAAWAEGTGDRFELFCADPSTRSPAARQVSRTGVAKADRPVHADGDVVVWVDDSGDVRWVRGCGGTPRSVDVPNLLGMSYPEVFYAERRRVHALNLESGRRHEVGVLTGAPDNPHFAFAGNRTFVAWAVSGTLFVLDRRDGALRQVALRGGPGVDEPGVGGLGQLTIGHRLVAYAQRIFESDVEYGFVYDVVTGTGTVMPTETYASGDRLLWREDTHYLVAAVPAS